jgi:hypothetical protein
LCFYSVAAKVRLAYSTSYSKLQDDELERWTGFIEHSHIQTNKVSPGPAFDWGRLRGLIAAAGAAHAIKPRL